MTRDVLIDPAWRADELGLPLPDSQHAVSVALPRWRDVVGYEEGDPRVINSMRSGYPRFMIHAQVLAIGRAMSGGRFCLPFPSQQASDQCAAYIEKRGGERPERFHEGNLYGVAASMEDGREALRAFWRHTGLITSSRQAVAHLEGRRGGTPTEDRARESLRRKLASIYSCDTADVFLHPTGMASIYAALRTINAWRPGLPTAQLGFSYVDSLKLQQEIGFGARFLPHRGTDMEDPLRRELESGPLGACFCEIPSNPLLDCVDVTRIYPLLRQHDVPLIVDDVVSTPYNLDLTKHSDLIVTSLTKYMAGTCDVMGGALICNPRSPYHDDLHREIREQHEELLWGEDAMVLDAQADGFAERMQRHNTSGLAIAERLHDHPLVEKVWYPKWECPEAFEAVRRPNGGWGGLLSFIPKDAARRSPAIYDAIRLCKGPSLGTVFTLVCPFTLLAHYNELDWAESCGVPRHLIRVSVGLEDPEALWRVIEAALAASDA